VTSISFWGYFWATAIGILPGTIVFCVLGNNMTDLVRFIWYAVSGIVALLVLGFGVRQAFNRRLANRARLTAEAGALKGNPGADASGK
jgi:uncharacterized membrane protein YdjX (TVP38/TMEM64 family)